MIVRVIKDSNYVVLNRTAANDDRLSYKAVGIHTYLMGKPDYWEGNETDIVRRHSDGRAAVRSGIEELITYGYLTRVRVVNKGKVMGIYQLGFSLAGFAAPALGTALYSQSQAGLWYFTGVVGFLALAMFIMLETTAQEYGCQNSQKS